MSNPNGKKGASYERLIADYLRDQWSEWIDRKVRTGAKDTGDIANFRLGPHRLVVECKNSVSYKELSGWLAEAAREAVHDGALAGIVVHKRLGKGAAGEQYVTLTLDNLLLILRAAQQVEALDTQNTLR